MQVFISKGFRTAGISDVAKALKLSHGAVYTYADSKQALLYLALLRVLDPSALETMELPVTAPSPDAILAAVEGWSTRQHGFDHLAEALARPVSGSSKSPKSPRSPQAVHSAQEDLGEIVEAIYDLIAQNRIALSMFERCSEDLPALAQWYFVERRRGLLAALAEFLEVRISAGLLRPVPDVPTAARFIVESIAWFAMHRHGDPDSAMLTDEDSRRTVRALVPAAFLPLGDPK